jgi:hypothetical protein
MKLSPYAPGILLLAAAIVGFLFVYLCLRNGVALNRGYVIERETRPLLYWLLILLYLLFALAVLWMAIDTMRSGVVAA